MDMIDTATDAPPTVVKLRVGLFATCLMDLCRPRVGFAAVKLLEDAGCSVEVPSAQTPAASLENEQASDGQHSSSTPNLKGRSDGAPSSAQKPPKPSFTTARKSYAAAKECLPAKTITGV